MGAVVFTSKSPEKYKVNIDKVDNLVCETPKFQKLLKQKVKGAHVIIEDDGKKKHVTVKEVKKQLMGNIKNASLDSLSEIVEDFICKISKESISQATIDKKLGKRKKVIISKESLLYLVGIEGTLFTRRTTLLNLDSFDNYLKELDESPGINKSFLYVGGKYSMFSLHLEDFMLFSISFLHEGSPKIWIM